MSATLGMQNTTVTMFGDKVNVPNNPIAKLMYYLSCVFSVIEYKGNRLTDFQNYYRLSKEEKDAVYDLAILFKPSIFLNERIFIRDQKLLLDSDNQFYQIKDEE